jgi:hypothetical protein
MVLTFTLQSAYSGSTYVAGPFDISGTTSGGITTLLGDNISKASLLTGVTISDIDDSTTGGTIQSVDGTCSNSIQWTVTGGPGGNETYTFQKYCTRDALNSPLSTAPTFVVFSGTELGFTPTQGASTDFIQISGGPNVDFIYEFNGTTGEAETLHTFLQRLDSSEINCDGPIG